MAALQRIVAEGTGIRADTTESSGRTLLTLDAPGIGGILTVVRPDRGPHDWLLGTWVVPR